MTLIITKLDAKGKRYLYADKRGSDESSIGLNNFNKIVNNGKVFISGAGLASDMVLHEIVLDYLVSKKPKLQDIYYAYKEAALKLNNVEGELFTNFECQALICFSGSSKCFYVVISENKLAIMDITEELFYSIGSGYYAAQALYFYDQDIEVHKIYETISRYDISVSSHFQTIVL